MMASSICTVFWTVRGTVAKGTIFKRTVFRWVILGAIAPAFLASCQPRPIVPEVPAAQELPESPATSSPPPASLSAPPPPPPGAYLAKVSPAVLDELQGMPAMAPAYIPEGFTLVRHEAQTPEAYRLIYRSTAAQCFAIEYSAADSDAAEASLPPREIAASAADSDLSVQRFDSPAFGPDRQLYYREFEPKADRDNGGVQASLNRAIASEWLALEGAGAYRFAGAGLIAQNYPAQTDCKDVSLTEAVKIITSLTDLSADSSVGPAESDPSN